MPEPEAVGDGPGSSHTGAQKSRTRHSHDCPIPRSNVIISDSTFEPRTTYRPQTVCGRYCPWEPTALHDNLSDLRVTREHQPSAHEILLWRRACHKMQCQFSPHFPVRNGFHGKIENVEFDSQCAICLRYEWVRTGNMQNRYSFLSSDKCDLPC